MDEQPVWNVKNLSPAITAPKRLRLSPFKGLVHPVGSVIPHKIQYMYPNNDDI